MYSGYVSAHREPEVPYVLRSRRAATDAPGGAALADAELAKNAAVEEVSVSALCFMRALCSMRALSARFVFRAARFPRGSFSVRLVFRAARFPP